MTTTATQEKRTPIDEGRLETFLHRAVGDMAAAAAGALTLTGYRLGLFRAMANAGPLTAAELAKRTNTRDRYVREWLNAQAAGGYVTFDPQKQTYELPPEQAFALADSESPVFLTGAYDMIATLWADTDRMADAFRSGNGIGWDDHDHRLYEATELFFRPGYKAHLTTEWIPALTGVEEKLRRGAKVADVGCGHGASAIIIGQAYPKSTVLGLDYHQASIDTARKRAESAGVANRVKFERARARELPGTDYDLICFFDCFHDLGDPLGAAKRAHDALAKDGTLMLVEPRAGDRVEENLNPVGRLYYSASTFLCTPNSLSQDVGTALGAQAGEARLAGILHEAGFSKVRRATETPFNIVLEARK